MGELGNSKAAAQTDFTPATLRYYQELDLLRQAAPLHDGPARHRRRRGMPELKERNSMDASVPRSSSGPVVVSAAERQSLSGQQTSGMQRQQAFVADDRWVGFVTSEPDAWSGWHHHGETDTYFYVIQGAIEFEYGEAGAKAVVDSGDFCHVPKGLVHRERPRPGARAELVLVRFGSGPTVVNVPAPQGRDTESAV